MNVLIDWYLTAHECHMNKLQNAAAAFITTCHQRQYITEYGDGDVPNPSPASERLNRGHGGFRTTPHVIQRSILFCSKKQVECIT
ncbi:hypothetical protein KIN20_010860 [Parelaphostrongylus tenuis]|uniref:Uncharacterized protein n=1 Tax=Parelaphostrongylus tenuis TaxID=148309 RepID=A0AAD5QLN4_PARTN|nr:hypothetical protein KIN20_010860 [Parelaphostrongylus tenuis]